MPYNKNKANEDQASLLKNLPGMAFRCLNDPKWTMLFVSEGCRELTGYEPSELLHNRVIPYEHIIDPADRKMVRREVGAAISEGRRYEITYRIRTLERQTKWVLERGILVSREKGEQEVIEGIIIDITRQKETEELLAREDALLRSMLLAIPGGVGMVRDRVFVWVNEGFCRMLGYGEKDLIGRSASMIYPSAEEFERVGKEKYARIDEEGIGSIHTRFLTRDGNEIDVLLSSTYVKPENPEEGTVFVATDISELKSKENELRENQLKYSQLVRAIPHLVIVVSTRKIEFVNPTGVQCLGYKDHRDLIGKNIFDFVKTECHPLIKEFFDKPGEEKRHLTAQISYINKNGDPVDMESSFVRMVYQGEDAVFIIGRPLKQETGNPGEKH